jgi:hypothetical protein
MAFEFEGVKGVKGWKRSLRLYKEGMKVYLMLAAPNFLVLIMAKMFRTQDTHIPLLRGIVRMVVTGAMIRATAEMQVGRQPNAVSCWLKSLSKLPTCILAFSIAVPIFAWGFIFFLIPGLVFVLGIIFTEEIAHLQSHSATGSLLGSWKLTSGHRWVVVWNLMCWHFVSHVSRMTIGTLVAFDMEILTVLLFDPLFVIFSTNLYIGLRGEKEGLDAETLKRELGNNNNDNRSPPLRQVNNGLAQDINELRDVFLGNLQDGSHSATIISDTEQQPSKRSLRKCGLYVVLGLIGIGFFLPFIFVAVALAIQPEWLSRIEDIVSVTKQS